MVIMMIVKETFLDPIPFNNSIDDFMHMFSWKPDYGTLAIGSKAGEVLLFSSKLELMSRMLLLNKSIHCLEWHPIGYSKENWLAIASKNTIVFDCSITSGKSTVLFNKK